VRCGDTAPTWCCADRTLFNAKALAPLGWRTPRGAVRPLPGDVHLYLVRVPPPGEPLDALLTRLTPAERARASEKRIEAKRREYVTGQATLRTLLGAALGEDPQRVRYRRGIKGKPYLGAESSGSGLEFNITHSGEMVLAALAVGVELGVDVEWHNERTDPQRVARRTFTPDERAALERIDEQDRRGHFFQMWTCKEALVKCTGLGIHSGMNEFQVALDTSGARVTGAWDRQAGVERLHVLPLPLGPGHAGALVHEPPALRVKRYLLADAPDPLSGF